MVKDQPDSHLVVAHTCYTTDMDRGTTDPSRVTAGEVGSSIGSMGDEEYQEMHWPVIRFALEQLLGINEEISAVNQGGVPPAGANPQNRISFEQTYTAVYKCVCRMHGDRLYEDLMTLVRTHLRNLSARLYQASDEDYVKLFHNQLGRYLFAMTGITPIFTYMDRCYLAGWRRTDLAAELHRAFAEEVGNFHMNRLMQLMESALAIPLGLEPSVGWELCRDLYRVNREYGVSFPHVFSRYVPCVQPPMHEDELAVEAHRVALMQSQLLDQGFTRGDCSRKRGNEDDGGGGGQGGGGSGIDTS